MNRPRHIAWIGFTLLLVSLASCRNGTSPDEIGDAEGELAPNPSFERGGSGPDGWTTYVNGTAPQSTFEWRQSGARTGSRSLSVTTRTADGFGWPGWRSDPIRIDSRQSYEMSIWYRTTTVASPSLEVDLFDTNGSYLRFFSVGPAGGSAESDGNWHEMKRTLDATVLTDLGAVEVRLIADFSVASGGSSVPKDTEISIRFDDVSFRAVGP